MAEQVAEETHVPEAAPNAEDQSPGGEIVPLATTSSNGERSMVAPEKTVSFLATLQHIAFVKVLNQLEYGRWSQQRWFKNCSREGNPFCKLHPSVIDGLTAALLNMQENRSEVEEIIRPLVTTGRLTRIEIYLKNSFSHEIGDILFVLSRNCENLVRFTLYQFCYALGVESEDYDANTMAVVSSGVSEVVSRAANLEMLTTDVQFDTTTVPNCTMLHKLSLNTFPCQARGLVPHNENNVPDPRASGIENIFIDHMMDLEHTPVEDVAYLLENLPRLQYIQWNIGDALELLHVAEFSKGRIEKKYPFQKAYLVAKSVRQAKIFSMTCPDVKELHLFVVDNLDVKNMWPLGALRQLNNLILNSVEGRPPLANFDFVTHCFHLLKHVGRRLEVFRTGIEMRRVDFTALDYMCPLLGVLKLGLSTDASHFAAEGRYFTSLTELRLIFKEHDPSEPRQNFPPETLVALLSSCRNLSVLQLFNVPHLKDRVLKVILRRNEFVQLREAHIIHCSVTEALFLRLVKVCKNLRDLCFESSMVKLQHDVLCRIVHDVNPAVIVRPYVNN